MLIVKVNTRYLEAELTACGSQNLDVNGKYDITKTNTFF